MQRQIKVNLGNLVLSLSEAMDLADPSITRHQQRVAFVVWEMAREAELCSDEMERVFLAALLHDIGAFSLEEKVSLHESKADPEELEIHCVRGQRLLEKVPWLNRAADIVRFHHRDWREWDLPIGEHIVFDSQLVALADFVERSLKRDVFVLHQHETIISAVIEQLGTAFHPDVVDLFVESSRREEFWLDLVSPRLYSLLLNEGPFRQIEVGLENILTISELFRNIIDFRSRFTSTHSAGVAVCGAVLASLFGLSETEAKLMEVAGNLHDIGKLAIDNSILNKPGKLTEAEMAVMKAHAYYTYSVIKTIGGLQQIAEWAGYHHEKLDGSGYPFRCSENELSTGARILMVADIFTALIEDRPYRQGMKRDKVTGILRSMADGHQLDSRIVELLLDNYDYVHAAVAQSQQAARTLYEQQCSCVRPAA